MILTYHDGEADKAATIGAILCDFTDLSTLHHHPVPEYNADTASSEVGDHIWTKGDPNWRAGFRRRKDAEQLIDYGWQEGTERGSAISLSLDGVVDAVEAIRRRPTWGDSGDSLDVDRALRGDWDIAFQSSANLRTNGTKIVTIIGAFGGNCNRTTEELFWNGVQIAVVTDILENAGYQCEVIGANNTRHYKDDTTGFCGVTAKRAGDPVRIDQLISVFAHAGVFRTIGFEMIVRTPTIVRPGLGTSRMSIADLTHSVRKLEQMGAIPEGAVIIGEAFSQKDAIKNIRATLDAVTSGVAA